MRKHLIPIRKARQNQMATNNRLYPWCEPDKEWKESVDRNISILIKEYGMRNVAEYMERER